MTKICVNACTGRFSCKGKHTCATWLKSHGITTVAMESTGSYWQNLYDVLIESGFEVFLLALCAAHVVAGRQTKNTCAAPSASMEGKTDVKDSRWIQFLHTCTAYPKGINTKYAVALACLPAVFFRILKRKSCAPCFAIVIFCSNKQPNTLVLCTKCEASVRCRNAFV